MLIRKMSDYKKKEEEEVSNFNMENEGKTIIHIFPVCKNSPLFRDNHAMQDGSI